MKKYGTSASELQVDEERGKRPRETSRSAVVMMLITCHVFFFFTFYRQREAMLEGEQGAGWVGKGSIFYCMFITLLDES